LAGLSRFGEFLDLLVCVRRMEPRSRLDRVGGDSGSLRERVRWLKSPRKRSFIVAIAVCRVQCCRYAMGSFGIWKPRAESEKATHL